MKGSIRVKLDGAEWETLAEGECGVVPSGRAFVVDREPHSIGMWVTQVSVVVERLSF